MPRRRAGCAHPAKHAVTRHELREATSDSARIRSWWGRWPWANIGVATGATSGLLVIDVDPRSGGTDSPARLESLMGSLPVTLTAATGGGGRHLFFAHPGGEVRQHRRSPLRGDRAPARHRSAGRRRLRGGPAMAWPPCGRS
jgi:hypothetical protein